MILCFHCSFLFQQLVIVPLLVALIPWEMIRNGADISLQDALDATNSLVLRSLKKPNIVDEPAGLVAPVHLPIETFTDKTSKLKHAFDVVGEIDFGHELKEKVRHCVRTNTLHLLPEPFGFKKLPDITVELQLAVVPTRNPNKFFLVKHFITEQQVKASYLRDLCFGTPNIVSWGGSAKNLRKALHYMFEKMGGYQVVRYSLQASAVASESKNVFFHSLSEEDIDAGFDFIEREGPRTHHCNTQLRWICKQLSQEDSPISQWPERLIKEALRNLMSDGVLALPVTDYPLTLVDVNPVILNILEKIFPLFNDKAVGMHGLPNVGKTPLARIIAMAMSRYWVERLKSKYKPAYRESSEFDFFRGEQGRKERPDIFDDGTLPEQPMRKLKGFCDVGNTVLTKERWGAAKFPQGQLRIYISNDIEMTAEPLSRSSGNTISHKELLAMLEPSWMKGTGLPDILAVLKRTCILIITSKYFYCRPATDKEVSVPRIPLDESAPLLRESSGPKYMQYRRGDRFPPDESHLAWERAWMHSVMDNNSMNMPETPYEIRGGGLFGDAPDANRLQLVVPAIVKKDF